MSLKGNHVANPEGGRKEGDVEARAERGVVQGHGDSHPRDPSHPQGRMLPPPPPQSGRAEEVEASRAELPQTAFAETIERTHSSSKSWHDQVIEEEYQGGARSKGESESRDSPDPNGSAGTSEGGAASYVSMYDDTFTQHDSDVMVEEEMEEGHGNGCFLSYPDRSHVSRGVPHGAGD